MQKTNGILVFLMLVAVILLGFIVGNFAQPHRVAPTYTPWPTYTPMPTYTPYPTITPILLPESLLAMQPNYNFPMSAIAKDYPRVDGSTSTKPLEDLLYCRFSQLDCSWEWTPGFERHIQFIKFSPEYYQYIAVPPVSLPQLQHHGTHEAYMNLINRSTDFILVARLPSAEEINAANAKGITLDARPVALDAFVILAHADNLVDTISIDQIRGIYSGQITNWSQVSGRNASINAYQREENSGSQELLKTLVMGDTPVIDAPEMIVYTMMGPFNAINGGKNVLQGYNEQGDPNGIGYSVYYYTWFIMGPLQNIKILAVEGIRPTSETIANQAYPLVAEVYVVIRADESPEATSVLLRDWLLTEVGQYVVRESGYVPILP
jgi:phosphate transport system substrate-binding protein